MPHNEDSRDAMPPNNLHHHILDNLKTAILLVEPNLTVSYINPAAESLLAVSDQRIHGEAITTLFHEEEDTVVKLLDAINNREAYTKRETVLTLRSGEEITVDYAVTPIVDTRRTSLIIELQPLDRLLRISREEGLLTSQQSSKALLRGIAHEIKNPLNFINNFGTLNADLVSEGLELLARHADDLKAEWVDHLKDVLHDLGENGKLIDKHGRKANHIVQSMMMLSREGVGERENYPLNILVEEYANLAYSGLLARDGATRVSFDRRYDDAVGHISLVVQSMGRVVLSIVTNAVESLMEKAACTPGFVPMLWISTQAHEDRVEIVVEDNGMGIPEAIRSKIYTPFFTTKDNEANIGLGLFISYDIVVQEHMGSVAMQTEEGRSCRFTLSLPRR